MFPVFQTLHNYMYNVVEIKYFVLFYWCLSVVHFELISFPK